MDQKSIPNLYQNTTVKNNPLYKDALKMTGSTLFATMFCVIVLVYMSFLINEGVWGAIIYQAFNLLIYTPIIYMAAWRNGYKDKNLVHGRHMNEDRLRGVKIGLLSIVPYGLCMIVMIFSKAGILPDLVPLVRFLYAPFIVFFNLLVPNQLGPDLPQTVLDASYLGIFMASLLQLYIPVVTGVAYRLGYKDISLYHKLIYRSDKKV